MQDAELPCPKELTSQVTISTNQANIFAGINTDTKGDSIRNTAVDQAGILATNRTITLQMGNLTTAQELMEFAETNENIVELTEQVTERRIISLAEDDSTNSSVVLKE